MNEKKPEYFEWQKTDKTKRPHRVYTTLSPEEKKSFEFDRITVGHRSNAAYLRQMIIYADLWNDIAEICETLTPEGEVVDYDKAIPILREMVGLPKEAPWRTRRKNKNVK